MSKVNQNGKRNLQLQRERMFLAALPAMNFNITAAAMACGVPPGSAPVWAYKTLKTERFQAMLATYVNGVVEKHDVKLDKLVMELKALAYSNIADFCEVDGAGQLSVNFANCSREQMKVISSVKVRERVLKSMEGSQLVERTTEFRMHNKQDALLALIRYAENGAKGLDPAPTNNIFNIDNRQVHVTVEQKADIYREMLEGQ